MFEHEGDLSSKISKMGIIKLNKVHFLFNFCLLACLFVWRKMEAQKTSTGSKDK